MIKQVQCPNCQSYNVKVTTKGSKFKVGISCLIFGAVLYYLGYIADAGLLSICLVLGVALVSVGLVYIALALTHKEDKAICKACQFKFNP